MKGPILFKSPRIIDPSTDRDEVLDILVVDGKITEIAPNIISPEGSIIIDLSDKWLVPGLVDMHVHLREPGFEYKETIETGTRAAASGGFTAVACMPNTDPPNDNEGITKFILDKAKKAGFCEVYPVAAITKGQRGKELTEFFDLLEAGVIAFSDDGLPVSDAALMRLALEYSLNFDALIISHSEELSLSEGGCMNEGKVSTLLGLKGIPRSAEEIAIFRDCALAELTGARVHIAHISTKGSVEIIRQAKDKGVRVTCETAPHYFSLTEERVKGYNTFAKMNPPLRTEEDRLAIIQGLKDGTIDVIATDHAPHESLVKECEFAAAANGIIGLETSLPVTLKVLYEEEGMSLKRIFELMSTTPSKILKIDRGLIEKGQMCDLTVIDPNFSFTFKKESIKSKSFNSPFLGESFKGKAILTICKGQITYDHFGFFKVFKQN